MEPEAKQIDPKGSQMNPTGVQVESEVAPREAKAVQKKPQGSQGHKIYTHKLPINRLIGQLVYILICICVYIHIYYVILYGGCVPFIYECTIQKCNRYYVIYHVEYQIIW